jgi:acyl-CoA thioester hydrolase
MPRIETDLELYDDTVPGEWLDYNGHMNVTWYTRVFDDAGEAFMRRIGMGETYSREHRGSWAVVETHLTYQRQLLLGERMGVRGLVLGHDAKRVHLFLELYERASGETAATAEPMILHLDLRTRRSAPFPDPMFDRIEALARPHAALPRPEQAGRAISLRAPR